MTEESSSSSSTPTVPNLETQAPWMSVEQSEFLRNLENVDATRALREKIEVSRLLVFQCPCNRLFDSKSELISHISRAHRGLSTPNDPTPNSVLIRYQCRQCLASYTVLKDVFRHLKVHEERRIFTYPLRPRLQQQSSSSFTPQVSSVSEASSVGVFATPSSAPPSVPSAASSSPPTKISESGSADELSDTELEELVNRNSQPSTPLVECFFAPAYRCTTCAALFLLRSHLQLHINTVHAQVTLQLLDPNSDCQKLVYRCLKCPTISRSWHRMYEHLRIAHEVVGKLGDIVLSKNALPSEVAAQLSASYTQMVTE